MKITACERPRDPFARPHPVAGPTGRLRSKLTWAVCFLFCFCACVRVGGGWRADTQVLSAQDGSELKEMFCDARCDIDSVVFCDADHEVEAIVVDYTQQEWIVQNDRIKQDVEALQAVCTG